MKTAIVVALLGLAGCGYGQLDRIDYYASTDAISSAAIGRACDAWAVVNVPCGPVARADANVIISGFSDARPGAALGQELGPSIPFSVRVNVGGGWDDDSISATISHEFGHALGMSHIATGPALMTAVATTDTPDLTPVDVAEFLKVQIPVPESFSGAGPGQFRGRRGTP